VEMGLRLANVPHKSGGINAALDSLLNSVASLQTADASRGR